MLTLSEDEIIEHIARGDIFEATIDSGAFVVKVEDWVPWVCAAIHNGHQLRKSLQAKCLLDTGERYQEEDPYTADIIGSFPITIAALDSRYEYDLNRDPENCVYTQAWGRDVWKQPLSRREQSVSRSKHQAFYRVLHKLLAALQERFGACMLYDVHTYNIRHVKDKHAPVFNLGTSQIDMRRWRSVVYNLRDHLAKVALPSVDVDVELDTVFQGGGFLARYVRWYFPAALVAPLEIRKVFMDEDNGDVYPLVLSQLKEELKLALSRNVAFFVQKNTSKPHWRRLDLLASRLDPKVAQVDTQLYKLAKGIETLLYINPLNLAHERQRFFARRYHYEPQFKYRQLNIDPYQFREHLYHLPVDDIKDITIQRLYRSVIDALANKIDMLASLGTEKFLYNSLRYYGEPSDTDINNAKFILYAPDIEDENHSGRELSAEDAHRAFIDALSDYAIDCKVEMTTKIVAGAMVNNARRAILINKSSRYTPVELNALIHHELGVHMVTTVNAERQELKILKLGLPGNTYTQEGLAILSEYLSGNLTLTRLKTLALRVVAVDMMIRDYDFSRTFKALTDDYGMEREAAFNIAARVFRGGGFTKDHVYLKGLRDALYHYKHRDIKPLFIGKTAFEFLPVIEEMIARDIFKPPGQSPKAITHASAGNSVLQYIVSSIR